MAQIGTLAVLKNETQPFKIHNVTNQKWKEHGIDIKTGRC